MTPGRWTPIEGDVVRQHAKALRFRFFRDGKCSGATFLVAETLILRYLQHREALKSFCINHLSIRYIAFEIVRSVFLERRLSQDIDAKTLDGRTAANWLARNDGRSGHG